MSAAPVRGLTMSKLIRSKATRHFLTTDGHWTGKVESAARFPEESLVRAAVQKFHLHDVELYYLFWEDGTSQFDFAIPLRYLPHSPRNLRCATTRDFVATK
jgi:hypothetical protein